MKRTTFGVGAMLVILAAALTAARTLLPLPSARSKSEVLQSIATNVLIPTNVEFAARCKALAEKANALTAQPTVARLTAAQAAWRDALFAWRRTQPFVHGPVDALGIYGRVQYWPARRATIDRVLKAT